MNNESCIVADHLSLIEGICYNKDCPAKQRLICLQCTKTIHELCKMNYYTRPDLINQLKDQLKELQTDQRHYSIKLFTDLQEQVQQLKDQLDKMQQIITNHENFKTDQIAKIQKLLQNTYTKEFFLRGYELINQPIEKFKGESIDNQLSILRNNIEKVKTGFTALIYPDNQLNIPQDKPLSIMSQQVIHSIALSPNGLYIASAGFDDFQIKIWDIRTGFQVQNLQGHTDGINHVSYSPCGMLIVSASADKSVRQWNTLSAQVQILNGHSKTVYCANYSSDQKYIVSCSADETVRFWDPETRLECQKMRIKHNDSITAMTLSKNQRVVYGDVAGKMIIWDYQVNSQVGRELNGHVNAVQSIKYSADEKWIISSAADLTIRLWELQSKNKIRQHTLTGHTGQQVYNVDFSPNMKYIISCGSDSSVKIWDLITQKQIGSNIIFHKGQRCAQFYLDSKHLITGGQDGQILIRSTLLQ